MVDAKIDELRSRLEEVYALDRTASLLGWDLQTYMPVGGAENRAFQLEVLGRTAHEKWISDEMGILLEDLSSELGDSDYDSFEASLIRVTQRTLDRKLKLSADLVGRRRAATSLATSAWEKARAASDFKAFRPHLEAVLDLTIEMAEALGYDESIYDPLLDEYEPGMTASELEPLFQEMKDSLVPLVRAVSERQATISPDPMAREYDGKTQWAFGLEVIEALGFDLQRGRQDRSAHPFTTGLSTGDVRLTTRIERDRLATGLFGTIHEAGHGMYEQGYGPALARTPLANCASLGVHESQSRMWENVIGRSRAFWTFWLPRLKAHFPGQLSGIDLNTFYRAVNRVRPSFIRVEADEVTYNLHIFLRFELEKALLGGEISTAELPEIWNQKMEDSLGVRPDNDAEGVLQDVHWANGLIGYFPTYSLGNLLSVQFYRQAVSELPDIPAQIEAGDFAALLGWMRKNIHLQGRKYTPTELVQRCTGGPIQTAPYLDYITRKYSELYAL
jgi:carboxypeptidase Taq